jgi:hypothetical protein
MANEFKVNGATAASVVYVVIERADGQMWRSDMSVFEAFNAANWSSYAVGAAVVDAGGRWRANFPPAIVAAGKFTYSAYYRAGASAAISDGFIGSDILEWDGTQEVLVQSRSSHTAAQGAAAVRTNLTTELGRIDENISAPKILTAGERTSIANEVEAQIIDETDTEKVLTAITNKIAVANPDLSGLTLNAIATAVRTNLATELGRIDENVSAAKTLTTGERTSITSGVWGAASRTLSAFGFTVNTSANSTETEILDAVTTLDTRTARVDAMIENFGGDRFTAQALEQAPAGGGAGGGTDWTATEREQIRHRIGIDGDAVEPTATPSLARAEDLEVTVNTTVDGGVALDDMVDGVTVEDIFIKLLSLADGSAPAAVDQGSGVKRLRINDRSGNAAIYVDYNPTTGQRTRVE